MFPHFGNLTAMVKFIHSNAITPGLSQTLIDVLSESLDQIGYDQGSADLEVTEGEALKGPSPIPAMVIKITISNGQSVCWAVLMNEHRQFYEIVRGDGSNFPPTSRH
jgi:hypothetical protein